jgi:hypothetical protein
MAVELAAALDLCEILQSLVEHPYQLLRRRAAVVRFALFVKVSVRQQRLRFFFTFLLLLFFLFLLSIITIARCGRLSSRIDCGFGEKRFNASNQRTGWRNTYQLLTLC